MDAVETCMIISIRVLDSSCTGHMHGISNRPCDYVGSHLVTYTRPRAKPNDSKGNVRFICSREYV